MKFFSTTWSEVSDKDIQFINNKLSELGETIERSDLPHIFSLQSMTPGGSKKVANYLRRLGYVREDWDEVKVHIMVDLLIQKFANDEFFTILQNTGDLYLIEGNAWDDTFWGECKGRGRNFLGRTLMQLRKFSQEELCDASDQIAHRLL
jgi:predicted NAD-dependent protein-ADP-ribosyltransferase YbiA (DUF1768 family)